MSAAARSHAPHRLLVASALISLGVIAAASPASATQPPKSWQNERILVCGGETVDTYLTPGGFGTPYHVVGSSDVIVPKHVEVVITPGDSPIVTLDVPGFDRTGPSAVHCQYVDPAGLSIDLWGLRV